MLPKKNICWFVCLFRFVLFLFNAASLMLFFLMFYSFYICLDFFLFFSLFFLFFCLPLVITWDHRLGALVLVYQCDRKKNLYTIHRQKRTCVLFGVVFVLSRGVLVVGRAAEGGILALRS